MSSIPAFAGYITSDQRIAIRLPIVLYNTGARTRLIDELQLVFLPWDEGIGEWQTFHPTLKPGAKDADTDDFAGPYAIDGRRSATRFVKFTHRLNGTLYDPRPTTCRVEARLDGSVSWSVLGTFTLYLGHMAHPETYITYRNSETPCSGEPEKTIDAWRTLAETRGLEWMGTADFDNGNGVQI